MAGFNRWTVEESDFRNITPLKARGLIIECFFDAQKETFARTKQQLGKVASDSEIRSSVEGALKLAFKEAGEDFEKPTKASLAKVVDILGRKAMVWGTPQDIIEHHKQEIGKVLGSLS